MNYVPMQKAFTGLNECIRIPISHRYQIFVKHSHRGYMTAELCVVLVGEWRTGV